MVTSAGFSCTYDNVMAAQSLVLCRDPEVLRTLCPLMFNMDMGVELCLGNNGAARMMQKRKFDAVIVECEQDGTGFELLHELRMNSPNRSSIAVGVVDDYKLMREAFATGANFVLSKPISMEDASRILRFAKGTVSRMVRRFLRVAVEHLSNVSISGLKDPAFILDLSEGGIAIQSFYPMPKGQTVGLSFQLPGTKHQISTRAKVAWADTTGRVGLEFEFMGDKQRTRLKDWVLHHRKNVEDEPSYQEMRIPVGVQLLSRWMKPLAIAIDGMFVAVASLLFLAVSYSFVKDASPYPLAMFSSGAVLLAISLYAALFLTLDMRFPGTRAVQSLFNNAAPRTAGNSQVIA